METELPAFSHDQLVHYALGSESLPAELRAQIDAQMEEDELLLTEIEGIRNLSLHWDAYTFEEFQRHMEASKAAVIKQVEAGKKVARLRPMYVGIAIAVAASVVLLLLLNPFAQSNKQEQLRALFAEVEQTSIAESRSARRGEENGADWEESFDQEDYKQALLELEKELGDSSLSPAIRSNMGFHRGICLYKTGALSQSMDAFSGLANETNYRSDAEWWRMLCLLKQYEQDDSREAVVREALQAISTDPTNIHGSKRAEKAQSLLNLLPTP